MVPPCRSRPPPCPAKTQPLAWRCASSATSATTSCTSTASTVPTPCSPTTATGIRGTRQTATPTPDLKAFGRECRAASSLAQTAVGVGGCATWASWSFLIKTCGWPATFRPRWISRKPTKMQTTLTTTGTTTCRPTPVTCTCTKTAKARRPQPGSQTFGGTPTTGSASSTIEARTGKTDRRSTPRCYSAAFDSRPEATRRC